MDEIITYAQNFEDVRLWKALKDSETKTYVDIGAGHATNNSVTRWFYEHGWRGINVEPGPNFDSLVAERPEDVNIQAAISAIDGMVPFFVYEPDLDASSLIPMEGSKEMQVESKRLDSLLDEKPIDFLKIDVEGGTLEVLESNDWERFRPRVLVIESRTAENESTQEIWEHVVLGAGYEFAVFDGVNCFYTLEPELIEVLQEHVSVVDEVKKYEPSKPGGTIEVKTPYLCYRGTAKIYARGDDEGARYAFNSDLTHISQIWDENAYRIQPDMFTGGVSVDIGANTGAFTLLVLATNSEERVLATEPENANYKLLKRNIEDNAWRKRTTLKKVGVWESAGFGECSGTAGQVEITAKNEGPVELVTLNDLLAPYHAVDVLKMDVQGAEYEILGSTTRATLSKINFLCMEYHSTKERTFGLMIGHLATTFTLTMMGTPKDGGMLWGHRFNV